MQTGFRDLDLVTGGFSRDDLVLIAGDTGTGKTAFTLNVALNAAYHREASAVFNFESNRKQIVQRLISTHTSKPMSDILDGNLRKEDWPELFRTGANPLWFELHIPNTHYRTVVDVRQVLAEIAEERDRAKRSPLSFVMLDPVQLMLPAPLGEKDRTRRLIEAIIQLKQTAKDLHVSIVVTVRLPQGFGANTNGDDSVLATVAGAEVFEEFSDKILVLHQSPIVAEHPRADMVEVAIAKNRGGRMGKVRLGWQEECGAFYSLPTSSVSTDG
jgi:replicative DNA helicase